MSLEAVAAPITAIASTDIQDSASLYLCFFWLLLYPPQAAAAAYTSVLLLG